MNVINFCLLVQVAETIPESSGWDYTFKSVSCVIHQLRVLKKYLLNLEVN